MNLTKELKQQIQDPQLTSDQQARLRCLLAKELAEAGDHDGACDALGDIWTRVGERPVLADLSDETAAEALLRAASLTAAIGSAQQIAGSQEQAKNLLSESLNHFIALGSSRGIAEAQIELAVCYWREGAFDESRVFLREAEKHLGPNDNDLRALAKLRSGIIESSAKRFSDALRIYTDAAPLLETISNSLLQGKFHHLFGTFLKNLAAAENRTDYIDQALIEFAAASYYFEEAQLPRHQACIENNLGFLFGSIGRFTEAHEHLDRAQMLFTTLKDSAHLAQVDETRARLLLAQGRTVEAEKTARAAVKALEVGGERLLLAEALTTLGIAQARLQHDTQALAILERAITLAEEMDDTEAAGNSALLLIEELGVKLDTSQISHTLNRATRFLRNSQDLSVVKRLANCTNQVLERVHASPRFPSKIDWTNFSFKKALLEYEAHLIDLALEDASGVVSRAARLLGFNHHQSLLALLNGRHEILRQRSTPIVPRRRSIIRQRGENGSHQEKHGSKRKTRILQAQHDPSATETISQSLADLGFEVDLCTDGIAAMERITGENHYDLILLDTELAGVGGQQLARLARSVTQHRRTPIIFLMDNAADQMPELVAASELVLKTEIDNTLAETVTRLLAK